MGLCYNASIIERHPMENPTTENPKRDGLETTIKVLTILKLLVQLAFYGIMLGAVIWFLLNNPIPGFVEDAQSKMFEGSFSL